GNGTEHGRIVNLASTTFEKSGGNGVSAVGVVFENSGLASVTSGTLSFSGGAFFINTGSQHAGGGATLQVSGDVNVPSGQSLSGGGTFDSPGLPLGGTLAPGDSLGRLTTTGDLVLPSTSVSLFEIVDTFWSTGYDVLDVGGD